MTTDYWVKEGRSFQWVRNWLYEDLVAPLFGIRVFIPSILEIGSGKGELAKWCRGEGVEYVGIEPNEKMATSLLAEGFKVFVGSASGEMRSLIMGNTAGFCYKKYDCILAAHVIEHMDLWEIKDMLEHGKDLLNAYGKIVLLYPDFEKIGDMFYRDYTHTYVTTKKRVENICEDAGLRIVRSGYYAGPFTNPLIVKAVEFIFNFVPMPESWRARIQVCGYTIAM